MKRRGALGAVVLAFALVLAACGGGGDGGGNATVSIKTLQAAVAKTQAAESSRFVMDMNVDADGHQVTIHGEGVSAGDGKTGQITMTLPSVGTIEERIADGTIYMNFGDLPFASKLDGKHWVAISLDELKQQTGTDLGGLADQAGAGGSQQGLEYLQGLSGDVTEVGTDTVAGAPATHYQASIDYSKVAAKLPGSSADAREKLEKIGVVPADVWIDGQDRVVKMHMTIDGSAFGGTASGDATAELTMEISDFGVPVDVQAPPADDVTDFSTLSGLSA